MRTLVLVLTLLAAGPPTAHAGLSLAGQITAGDWTQTGSLDLSGSATSCATATATPPGISGNVNYDRYGFMNTDSVPHCFTVSVTSSGDVQAVIYSTSYTQSNPQTGYLADSGACTNLGAGNTISFSVTVPPGGFYVIVSDCIGGSFGTPTYTLAVNFDTLFDDMSTQPTLTRNSILQAANSSTCGLPSPTPPVDNASVDYDAYTLLNTTAAAECVTATIRHTSAAFLGVVAFAYLGSFDPANPQTNYIGESANPGNCDIGEPPTSFSFGVPAGASYVLVVDTCGQGKGDPFAIDIAVSGPPTRVTLRSGSAERVRGGVLVRWRTASEAQTLGFYLYRERDGRLARINRRLIPSSFAGTTTGCRYSWFDRHAPPGHLRYRIQAVGLSGTRTWIGSTRTS